MHGLSFDDLTLFARVAALGTLSAVARERDVPVSQISRSLARIEKTAGARLIHRSTHGLALTAEGETFLDYCHRLGGTLEELEGEFAAKSREPSGVVRVAASTVIAQYQLLPSLAGLNQRHPQLRIELEVNDRLVDMVRDGIDIAIRTSTALPETLVARQIGTLGRALYASPAYLAQAGEPAQPSDLLAHQCIVIRESDETYGTWHLHQGDRQETVKVRGMLSTNDGAAATTWALEGHGVLMRSEWDVAAHLAAGRLVRLLPAWSLPAADVTLVYPTRSDLSAKTRALADFLRDWFASPPRT